LVQPTPETLVTRPTLLFALLALLLALVPSGHVAARQPGSLGVQAFLDAQPGPLKAFREDGRSAAAVVEGASLYYGLSPRLHLALLEATARLISDPAPPAGALDRPFGAAGPAGFAAQIEWASRELRAGLGPYERPPVVRFSDGVTLTLTLDQAPEGVAVQRFLARGRTQAEWRAAVDGFGAAFATYFNNELVEVGAGSVPAAPAVVPAAAAAGFLLRPWPAGVRAVHLAYFDHELPTVDSGAPGNGYVVNYLGRGNVQYDGHDGHDFYFPDQPIGTPILAAAAGTAYARTHRGNGVVIVHPGGYETVYWHLDGFAPVFAGLIDSSEGVPVQAGALLGTSGRSGFVGGNPHLHFEVRRYGKQVDPYGWYGPGADPCLAYAGCTESAWLWHASLAGSFDFTPPGSTAAPAPPARDAEPPVGTLAVNPPPGLLLRAAFDGSAVQSVGRGFPSIDGTLAFAPGRADKALRLGPAGLTYPVAGNLRAATGTIALWAELPERYPASRIERHYLFAASASPDGAPVYSGTLALRRDLLGPGAQPQWTFWTTAANEASRDLLSAPDTLAPGWHHFAVTWDAAAGRKALYIDGKLAAAAEGAVLPAEVGDLIQIGRFTYGGAPAGALVDDLAIYGAVLDSDAIAALASPPEDGPAPQRVTSRSLRLDTNAIDSGGGIVAVRLGLDGRFEDPQPYYDSYRWLLPEREGEYTLAARYFDRAGNSTTVSQTVQLDLPPRAELALDDVGDDGAALAVRAEDDHTPLEMQVSQRRDFAGAAWQPFRAEQRWAWDSGRPRRLYVRLRDANGTTGAILSVSPLDNEIYLPALLR